MRNLEQNPITLDEMIAAVERAAKAHDEAMKKLGSNASIGGIHGAALHEAASRLKRLQFAATTYGCT